MPGEMVAILIPISFFFAVVWFTKIISDNRLRRKMLEMHTSSDLVRALAYKEPPATLGALKWGLVAGSVGVALILVQVLDFDSWDAITYGLMLLFGGLGLIVYYVIARRVIAEDERQRAELSSENSDRSVGVASYASREI